MCRRTILTRLLLLLMIAGAIAATCVIGGRHLISLKALAEHRIALRALVADHLALAALAYALAYMLAVTLMFPAAAALTMAGGFLFGWAGGFALAVPSATAGATVVFLLARTALGDVVMRRAGGWVCRLRGGFQKDALSYLLFLRLVPAFPFWFMNVAPALIGVSLRDFVVATTLGIMPGTLAFAFMGSGIDAILAEHYKLYMDCLTLTPPPEVPCRFGLSPRSFVSRELVAALVMLGVVAILPAIAKRLWKSKASRA